VCDEVTSLSRINRKFVPSKLLGDYSQDEIMKKQSAGSKSSQYFFRLQQLASCQRPACFDAFFSQAPIPPQVSLTYLIIVSLRSQLSQSSGEKKQLETQLYKLMDRFL